MKEISVNNVIPVLPRVFLELQRGRALDPEPRQGGFTLDSRRILLLSRKERRDVGARFILHWLHVSNHQRALKSLTLNIGLSYDPPVPILNVYP